MAEPTVEDAQASAHPVSATCARCGRTLTEGDRVDADDRAFCRSCYAELRHELEQALTAMTTDVNYTRAALGAAFGAALGVLAWWGFTVLTKVAFGLIAVAIGFLAGHGAVRLAEGKRSRGVQLIAVGFSVAAFFVASYLVNMSFVNRALAERGESWRVGFLPSGLDQFVGVIGLDFGIMDLVFLAIAVWQAWATTAPPKLARSAA